MSKNKLQKFAENLTFEHLLQPTLEEFQTGDFRLRGRWSKDFFHNDNPIVLELGCGKGDYTIALAKQYPEKNFIGMDIKGARLWRGCKNSLEQGLDNVGFLRTKIQNVDLFFATSEVEEIWITFPDPQPRISKSGKRLTSPPFLRKYSNVLIPEGIIHLKTDNVSLFDYTLEVVEAGNHHLLKQSRDVYADELGSPITTIQTFYEQMWLAEGLKIHYLRFKLNRDESK